MFASVQVHCLLGHAGKEKNEKGHKDPLVIDLHMHTTASDGLYTPEELVERARRVGIRTLSVTDHDTTAAIPQAVAAAERFGMTVVPGIEITATHAGRDVHVLAYFVSNTTPGLATFLSTQRHLRLERAMEIVRRLAQLGVSIDQEALLSAARANGGKSVARPQIAQALVDAGHVASIAEAFDRYLAEDGPAYVPHGGATPADVVSLVSGAGGVAALAHPGYRPRDEIIPGLVDAGLGAIEAYHSSHDEPTRAHYLAVAERYGLAVSGGSDYHGEGMRRAEFFGVTHLPREQFTKLLARAHREQGNRMSPAP